MSSRPPEQTPARSASGLYVRTLAVTRKIECHFGDIPGDQWRPMMLPSRPPKYAPPDWIRRGLQVLFAWIATAVFIALVIVWLITLFLFTAQPSLAQVQVPIECVQLARREGYPTDVMSKTQVARARLRMSRLSDDDPIVRPCRDAVARLIAIQKEMNK